MKTKHHIIKLVLFSAFATSSAFAQSADDMNKANNPLTPMLGVNFQDYYTPSYDDLSDSDSNTGLLRGILPHKLFGWPQILRATLPIATSPTPNSTSGLGDLNVFDVALFKAGKLQLGVGPQITLPTATDDRLGTGKLQAGAAVLAIAPQSWGLVGGLVTWQHSIAGEGSRPVQNNLQMQPFLIYNLPKGFYARSTALWNFNLQTDDYYIPVGAGAGKVWQLKNGMTVNFFVEPQYTLFHDGVAPRWQIFMGLNFQFPLVSKSSKSESQGKQ
ncbi:MAG TPA: hypothetical protein VHG89_02320 [Verrucomicrobiae bacterium]|nr:hypothetical protein [Verrucomicrobiae bacterium]